MCMNKINLGTLQLSCKTKPNYTNHNHFTRLAIAYHVTCFARFELLKKLCALPDKSILYFDTDSIIYFSENGDSLIEEGTNWAKWFWNSKINTSHPFVQQDQKVTLTQPACKKT